MGVSSILSFLQASCILPGAGYKEFGVTVSTVCNFRQVNKFKCDLCSCNARVFFRHVVISDTTLEAGRGGHIPSK